MVFQAFAKLGWKQNKAEVKSLCKHLSWLNHKIYEGQISLTTDKVQIKLVLKELENNIWQYDFSNFEEKWLLKEGHSTKEFLYLEDLRLSKKEISELYNSQGETEVEVDGILSILKSFYENLYSYEQLTDTQNIKQFLESLNLPKVANDFACNTVISENDVLDVIAKLNTGKSLGPDGFTPDFYQIFGPYLADLLARNLNDTFCKESLPYMFAQAIIVLFFK